MAPPDDFPMSGKGQAVTNDARIATGIFVLGHVVAVAGAKAAGVMANDSQAPADELANALQIGAMVKIPTRRSIAIGIVNGLGVENPSEPPFTNDVRTIQIDLFGEMFEGEGGGAPTFQRGISVYPTLGQPILPATHDDLAHIYARPNASNVRVGSLYQDSSLPAYVITDKLLGEHFAVLGTSGSGKSCTVALLLRTILEAHPSGHIVLLDPHNEYSAAFGEKAELVNTETLKLPFWLLNFEESCAVMTTQDGISSEAERAILKEAIQNAKVKSAGEAPCEHYTVDTPVPYRLTDLTGFIDDAMGRLNKADNSSPYIRLKTRIDSLRNDKRFAFMFAALTVRDIMAEILSRLLRIPVWDRPVTIVDLSGVPSEIVDVVVSVLVRMIFDFAVWSERDNKTATLLVCEEAHRYIPRDDKPGFGPTRRIIAQIAKEGRKYGVSLGLVTQRPSEISETILSQCNTLFALRMNNDRDQTFVQRAMPESALGFLASLPALHRQEAIVVGEGVTLPMRIRFDNLAAELRPRSRTTSFSTAWQGGGDEVGLDRIESVVDRWRRQTR